MSTLKRGNKEVVSIKIRNKSLYIDLLKVNAISLNYFDTKFENSTEEIQTQIKDKVRDICKDLKEVNTQNVDDEIFIHFLSKKIQKGLTSAN